MEPPDGLFVQLVKYILNTTAKEGNPPDELVQRWFEDRPVCSSLSFSLSNLSAAFFGSATFQLLLIVLHLFI